MNVSHGDKNKSHMQMWFYGFTDSALWAAAMQIKVRHGKDELGKKPTLTQRTFAPD